MNFGAKIGTSLRYAILKIFSKNVIILARKLLLLELMAWHCWVIRFINYLAYYEADPEEEHHYQGDMRRTVNSSESRQNVGGMVNYQCR